MDIGSEIIDLDIGSEITDIGTEITDVTPHPHTSLSSLESTESALGVWKELINEMPALPAPPRPRDPKENLFGIDVSEFEPLSKTEYDMLHTAYPGPSGALPITGKAVVLRGSVARQLKRKGITSVVRRIRWEPLHKDIKHCCPNLKKR